MKIDRIKPGDAVEYYVAASRIDRRTATGRVGTTVTSIKIPPARVIRKVT